MILKRIAVGSALMACFVGSTKGFAAGDAGCGLGSLIFKQNTKVLQIVAATTNQVVFFNQLFGIAFGTSNCSASALVMLDKEQVKFAEANFSNLKSDMAHGEGEYVVAFSTLMGCSESGIFAAKMQTSFDRIIETSETGPLAMLMNVKTELKADPLLSEQCTRI